MNIFAALLTMILPTAHRVSESPDILDDIAAAKSLEDLQSLLNRAATLPAPVWAEAQRAVSKRMAELQSFTAV